MAPRKSPRDHTGHKSEVLAAEHADELERRQAEIGLITAQQNESRNTGITDYTGAGTGGLTDSEVRAAAAMRQQDSMHLPLGATKQPGQSGVTVDAAGHMADSGQPNWPGVKTNDTGDTPLATPVASVVAATTGGTIAHSTALSYIVTATNLTGETVGSTAATVTTGAGTETNKATVSWAAVPGAAGYKVYGRTSGSEGLLATITDGATTTWVDTGAGSAGAAPPVSGTSGTLPTGTETPFTVPGGTLADQQVRPTVDTVNASRVGVVGGPDPEAPRVWLLGDPNLQRDPDGPVTIERQPVHNTFPEGVQQVVGGVQTLDRHSPRVIRVNTTLEHVTFGVGTDYNFVEGQKYRVPPELADYLEELGYVYH